MQKAFSNQGATAEKALLIVSAHLCWSPLITLVYTLHLFLQRFLVQLNLSESSFYQNNINCHLHIRYAYPVDMLVCFKKK